MNLDDILNASRVFVDANVILYALDHKSPSCRRFLSRCDGRAVEATISTVTLAEVAHRRMVEEACAQGLTGSNPAHALGRRPELIRDCTAAALRVALDSGAVCADDVRAVVPIPDGINPKFVGCVFRDLADAGILRRDGYQPSKRPKAHARPITLWRLADAHKATARLATLRTD